MDCRLRRQDAQRHNSPLFPSSSAPRLDRAENFICVKAVLDSQSKNGGLGGFRSEWLSVSLDACAHGELAYWGEPRGTCPMLDTLMRIFYDGIFRLTICHRIVSGSTNAASMMQDLPPFGAFSLRRIRPG